MTTRGLRNALSVCFVLFHFAPAFAQSASERFELGAQFAVIRSSEFEAADLGVGARFSWLPDGLVGVDSEINFYPRGFPSVIPFSNGRIEALFGATVGPRIGAVRPFAKGRAGFLNISGTSQPFVCALIFPPPISCELANGHTLPAFDFGGGFELLTRRTFARLEIGDRVLRYPGPVLSSSGVHEHSFFSHDLRLAAGTGLRF
jgi:hypothetical protein